jgi:hypothetical protein
MRIYFALPAAGILFFVSAWLLMIFTGGYVHGSASRAASARA